MEPAERPDELVVATPERVAFEYTVAGLGSRFMAHAIDVLILLAVFFVLSFLSIFLGAALGGGNLALLLWLLVSFLLFVLYFPILEGLWNGQTLGKRLMRIRVLGDRGEPVTMTQVAIRNLVRLVDFLPVFYGVGIVTLFVQGGSKRLGDFAAGTVVVRDRERIRLKDLVRAAAPPEVAPQSAPAASIWADRQPPGQIGAAGGAGVLGAGSGGDRQPVPQRVRLSRPPSAGCRWLCTALWSPTPAAAISSPNHAAGGSPTSSSRPSPSCCRPKSPPTGRWRSWTASPAWCTPHRALPTGPRRGFRPRSCPHRSCPHRSCLRGPRRRPRRRRRCHHRRLCKLSRQR